MLITMLGTHRLSEDGFKIIVCEKGKTYDLADTCATHCLNKCWAYNAEPEKDFDNWFEEFKNSLHPPSKEQMERIMSKS